MIDLRPIWKETLPIILNTADFIRGHYRRVTTQDIEVKAQNSLVSFVDKQAEKQLVKGLGDLIPDAGFVTEEDTEDDRNHDYVWIIDPLDGTTNFLNEIPVFSVSVALAYKEEIIMGVVHDVMQGDTYHAIKGEGAYLNGEQISVSEKPFSESMVATGFPYAKHHDMDPYMDIIKYWITEARGVRRLGSAAIDLAYVAAGRFGAYYENFLNIWDIAAGTLIVREAGGKVTNFDGNPDVQKGNIIASAPQLYDEMFGVINRSTTGLRKIEHIGIAVQDLDEAEITYEKLLGVKPYKREAVASEHVMTSFFKSGPNKIELLAATSEESAIYKYLQKNRPGVHHIAYAVEDIKAEMKRLEKEGFKLLHTEPKRGADNKMICFIHPKTTVGVLTELCQEIPEDGL